MLTFADRQRRSLVIASKATTTILSVPVYANEQSRVLSGSSRSSYTRLSVSLFAR